MLQNQRHVLRLLRLSLRAPGYQFRRSLGEKATFEDDEEEPDFMQLHEMHRQHEKEMEKRREHVKHLMIKHKYFRDKKLPNFLTYNEKEQMRILHTRDPTEWTAERLTESFPVTLEVARKILLSKWKPRNEKRIRSHDEAVIQNWEKLRAGECDEILPPELKEHLQKFADRNLEDIKAIPQDALLPAEIPKPRRNEFLSIITSCNKYADKEQKVQQEVGTNNIIQQRERQTAGSGDPENETYLLDKVTDKRQMRLEELKRFKLTPADLQTLQIGNVKQPNLEKRALEAFGNPSGTGIVQPLTESVVSSNNLQTASESQTAVDYFSKYESNEVIISAEDCKRYEMSTVKDRIYIPRKIWRKGATYRLEDCYYDDDGEFLYRVPGMTGQARKQ